MKLSLFLLEKEMKKLAKVRQDAWSHEDDLLLAETVLRHIRQGSTQLNAFEEVGDKLNRTSAACGFRWNAEIRNKYESAVDLAKRQRKEKKRAMQAKNRGKVKQSTNPPIAYQSYTDSSIETETSTADNEETNLTLDSVIHYLTQLKVKWNQTNQSKVTLDHTKQENERLHEQIADLEKQLERTQKQLNTIQEDYRVFVQIMDRARKMTVLDDQGSFQSPKFVMDKNGNLEQIQDVN